MASENRSFIKYIPPPNHPSDCRSYPEDLNDEILEWKERMKYIHDDVDWLLRLNGAQFWKQITKDETFSQSYDSFWQFCPRPYDLQNMPSQCLPIHNQMKKLMLLLFLRICDDAEMDGFADSSHASIIYDNFLIDVPKILDICCIYASAAVSTKEIISKALLTIFKKQEGYWHDLDIAVDTIIKTIDNVAEKFALLEDESESGPKQLANDQSLQFSNDELNDVSVYLYDTFNSMVALLSFCGFTSRVFFVKGALQRATAMVDKYLPRLKALFRMNLDENQRKIFARTKKLCFQFCHIVLRNCFFNGPSTAINDMKLCEDYLDVINLLLPESKFIIGYERRYKFSTGLYDIEEKLQSEFGDTIQFVQQVLNSLMPENATAKSPAIDEHAGAAASMSNDAIDGVVMQVKSMMPDENDAFLRACVVHFDGDPEKVMNHLLEANIPPFLQELRQSKRTVERKNQAVGLKVRENTDDGKLSGHYYMKSEILSKDIQDEIFNDKTASKDLRDYLATDDHDYAELKYFDEYDDEYDDTYDSHNVGAMDADSGDELKDITTRRSFVKPKVLQALEKRNQSDDEQKSDEEEGTSGDDETQTGKNETQQTEQPYQPRHAFARGRGNRRGDGRRQGNRGRHESGGARARTDRNNESTRGRGETRPARGRGRGGHVGKKHNQKTLAFKKSNRGMGGF